MEKYLGFPLQPPVLRFSPQRSASGGSSEVSQQAPRRRGLRVLFLALWQFMHVHRDRKHAAALATPRITAHLSAHPPCRPPAGRPNNPKFNGAHGCGVRLLHDLSAAFGQRWRHRVAKGGKAVVPAADAPAQHAPSCLPCWVLKRCVGAPIVQNASCLPCQYDVW